MSLFNPRRFLPRPVRKVMNPVKRPSLPKVRKPRRKR